MVRTAVGVDGVKTNKGERFAVEVLSGDEVRALVNAASRRGSCGLRDRALITLLYRAGLRIAEALALLPKDVDLAAGALTVLHGKGDKRRVVGFDESTAASLQLWLARRQKLGLNGIHPLFCTLSGGALQRVQFAQRLKALAKRAGIEKRVHPHGLRHSFAAKMAEEKIDLRLIQMALGHGSIATTDRYIRHVQPQAVIDAMRGRSW